MITQEDSTLTIKTSQGPLFSDHNVIYLHYTLRENLTKPDKYHTEKNRELTSVPLNKE